MTSSDLQAKLNALAAELDDLLSSDDESPPSSAGNAPATSPQKLSVNDLNLDTADQDIDQDIADQLTEAADQMIEGSSGIVQPVVGCKEELPPLVALVLQDKHLVESARKMLIGAARSGALLQAFEKTRRESQQTKLIGAARNGSLLQALEKTRSERQQTIEASRASEARLAHNEDVPAELVQQEASQQESASEASRVSEAKPEDEDVADHRQVEVAILESAAHHEEARIQEPIEPEREFEAEGEILPSDLVCRDEEMSVDRSQDAAIPLLLQYQSRLVPVARSTSVDHSQISSFTPQPPPRVGGAPRVGGPPRRQRPKTQLDSNKDPQEELRRREKLEQKAPVPAVLETAKRRQQEAIKHSPQKAEHTENKEQVKAEDLKWSWKEQSKERQQRIQLLQEENRKKQQKRERRERKMQQDREEQQSQCSVRSCGEFITSGALDSAALAARAAHLEDEVAQIDRRLAEAESARQEALAQSAMAEEKMEMIVQQSRNVSRATSRANTPAISVADTLPESICMAADTAADRVREWKKKMREEMRQAEMAEAEELENRRGRRLPEDPNVYDGKSLCVWCGDVAGPGHDNFCVLRPAKCRFCGMKLAAVMQSQHEVTCPERTDAHVYNVAMPTRSHQQRGRGTSKRSDQRFGSRGQQHPRSGSRCSQLSRCGSAASVRSASSVSSQHLYGCGSQTPRRFRAETPSRSRPGQQTPRRNLKDQPQRSSGAAQHGFQPRAPQRPQAETPRRGGRPVPRRYQAETPQRTPQQSPRHMRLDPLVAPPVPSVGSHGQWGVPPPAQQHPVPPQGYFDSSASSGCRMRPAGQANFTPRRAMPNGAQLAPMQVPPSPVSGSVGTRGRTGRSQVGSARSSRATTPLASPARPQRSAQPRAQATPRARGRQARQMPAASPRVPSGAEPFMHGETKDKLRNDIQEERHKYISQKLSSATPMAGPAHMGMMPSTNDRVPTTEELRKQMQMEREEFIQRRAHEMAALESLAAC